MGEVVPRAPPPPQSGGGREVYLAPGLQKGELEEVVVATSGGHYGPGPSGGAHQWQPPPPLLPLHVEGPITDPPPAYSEGQRKVVLPPPLLPPDNNGADARRGGGLLSALLDKVRPREEGSIAISGNSGGGRRSQTTECLAFGLKGGEESRWPQPLLENLDCTGTLRGLAGSREENKKGASPAGGTSEYAQSAVQKPYEPPVLGKSSRITPVGDSLYIRVGRKKESRLHRMLPNA
jgi:hypothetical protein